MAQSDHRKVQPKAGSSTKPHCTTQWSEAGLCTVESRIQERCFHGVSLGSSYFSAIWLRSYSTFLETIIITWIIIMALESCILKAAGKPIPPFLTLGCGVLSISGWMFLVSRLYCTTRHLSSTGWKYKYVWVRLVM